MTKLRYLDYAAATPLDPQVLQAMQPYFLDRFYNPSAQYLAAKLVADDVMAARQRVAQCLGAKPSEVIFTSGGTEANNIAIHGVMRRFPRANCIVSSIEHESVLQPAGQYECKQAPVNSDGVIDMAALAELIDDQTVLISVMYANNEIGTLQPIARIADGIKAVRAERQKAGNPMPLYFHSDAAQAANYLDVHVSRLGVDMLTLNGGKIYGPKQTGALFVRSSVMLQSLIQGGGQERGIRSGTENVPGIIGFAHALDHAQAHRVKEVARLKKLQALFFQLLDTELPTAVINGSLKRRLPNNVHLTIPGTDNERLMLELDQRNIICAVGSACSASNEEPSHVLTALGLDRKAAQASLRFTMGRFTSEADVRVVAKTLAAIL